MAGKKKAASFTAPDDLVDATPDVEPAPTRVDLWFVGEKGALKLGDRALCYGDKFTVRSEEEAADLLKRPDVTSTEPPKPKGKE